VGGEQHLGLLRAIVIVWIGGAVTSALVGALLYRPLMVSILVGSQGHPHHLPLINAAAFLVTRGLLGAIAVTVGVQLVGFRVGYLTSAFALTLGGAISLAITFATISATTGDATHIAGPALGVAVWPLQLLLGLVLPAHLIDVNSSSGLAPPPRPYHGQPL